MLIKIKIENLALLKECEITCHSGLLVLTGETGAGKSVIVNAIALALGARTEKDYIRHGAKFASVEALFRIKNVDDDLTVYREFTKEGSSKIKVNGKNATLNHLRTVTEPLAEIMGQHANQELMNENNHLEFLDRFAFLENQKEIVFSLFEQWKKTSDELKRVISKQRQLQDERELLLFQKKEIEAAGITIGEEEKLTKELKLLNSARMLMTSAETVQNILSGEENSLIELLNVTRKEMEKIAEIDKTVLKQATDLIDVEYQLDELRRFVEQYGSNIQDNPGRIEEINLRLDEIYKLKKKYGGSESSILNALIQIVDQLKDRPDISELIEKLQTDYEKFFKEYSSEALVLSKLRVKGAEKLQKLVIKELKELSIDNGGFKFDFLYEEDPDGVIVNGKAVKPFPYGLENCRILFSANPGEPLKSLVKTASGGEISRVLLALKAAEKSQKELKRQVLIFDEVDSGIGGKTAIEVGKKLKILSENCQVIVITHLHQIARLADYHYLAEKTVSSGKRSLINVKKLNNKEIKAELERMTALPIEN